MNYTTDENGNNVVAQGAPGSLARLRCEFPYTWPIRMSARMMDDASNGAPTHFVDFASEDGESREYVWYVGSAASPPGSPWAGASRHYYVIRPSWRPVFERYAQLIHFADPLPEVAK